MTYSINYYLEDSSEQHSVDWDWEVKCQWARSTKSFGGCWEVLPGIDEHAKKAIMEHFGLGNFTDFSLDDLITTSWQELGQLRRMYEGRYELAPIEMKTQALGNEEYVP